MNLTFNHTLNIGKSIKQKICCLSLKMNKGHRFLDGLQINIFRTYLQMLSTYDYKNVNMGCNNHNNNIDYTMTGGLY